MVRYFYSWTPLVIVGTALLLSLPWLGVIALATAASVALGALAALAWAIVVVPYTLAGAVSRRWQVLIGATPRTAPALSPAARRESDPIWQGAPSPAAAMGAGRELQRPQHTFSERHAS